MDKELSACVQVLKKVSSILDNIKYECRAREYTLDEEAMSDIFHCRDIADEMIRQMSRLE